MSRTRPSASRAHPFEDAPKAAILAILLRRATDLILEWLEGPVQPAASGRDVRDGRPTLA